MADVAVDAEHVYWAATSDERGGRRIGRANLDGTNVDRPLHHRERRAAGVAVDAPPDTKLAGKATARADPGPKRQGDRRRVKVKAKERAHREGHGKIKINPTYKLKPKKVQVAAGETKKLRLKPKKARRQEDRHGAQRGEKATAKLTVKLTDLAGNTETEKLRVRLKR